MHAQSMLFVSCCFPLLASSQALDLTYYVRASVCGISVSSSAGNAQRIPKDPVQSDRTEMDRMKKYEEYLERSRKI
jgi:hypothetical protein